MPAEYRALAGLLGGGRGGEVLWEQVLNERCSAPFSVKSRADNSKRGWPFRNPSASKMETIFNMPTDSFNIVGSECSDNIVPSIWDDAEQAASHTRAKRASQELFSLIP